MGRDARIKRERRRAPKAQPPPPVDPIPQTDLEILTVPFAGREDDVADDGYFDDCAICRALRDGDVELALQHMRASEGYVDLREVDEVD